MIYHYPGHCLTSGKASIKWSANTQAKDDEEIPDIENKGSSPEICNLENPEDFFSVFIDDAIITALVIILTA